MRRSTWIRRPPELSPAWFVTLAVLLVVGGLFVGLFDAWIDDEPFDWSQVIFFVVVIGVLNVVTAGWRRRKLRERSLS